jgi:hypothetical protein
MNTTRALIAICALALSTSPAWALNKSRVISGVESYNTTSDGSITSTFQSNPLSYQLSITSPQFSEGEAGVNFPQAFLLAPKLSVANFTSFTCTYTTPNNKNADNFLDVSIQNESDGLFYLAGGNSTKNSGVFSFTVPAANFSGLPSSPTVLNAALIFFGGSNKNVETITLSNFAINGSNTDSVANGFFVFDTVPDNRFNFQQPPTQ